MLFVTNVFPDREIFIARKVKLNNHTKLESFNKIDEQALDKIKWWNSDMNKLRAQAPLFTDIDKFITDYRV